MGGPIYKLGQIVISRSESAYSYSVALIFCGSAGPGLMPLSLYLVMLGYSICMALDLRLNKIFYYPLIHKLGK